MRYIAPIIGAALAAAALAAPAAAVPSCDTYFDGLSDGTIIGSVSMQQNPRTGSIQWGINIADARAYGLPPWNVQIRVGTYRQTVVRPYPPHGSIPGRKVIPGTVFRLSGRKQIPHGVILARLACQVEYGRARSPRPGYQTQSKRI